jgi:hypothetical protein
MANRMDDDKNPRCCYCGVFLLHCDDAKWFLNDLWDHPHIHQRDHVIARARGGVDDDSNLVDACRWCNMAKGPWSQDEFRAWLSRKFGLAELIFFGEGGDFEKLKVISETVLRHFREVYPKESRQMDEYFRGVGDRSGGLPFNEEASPFWKRGWRKCDRD